MFLFIAILRSNGRSVTLFKYISCSYLSIRYLSPNPPIRYLNTSHVLIYRCSDLSSYMAKVEFKYISCSYLSFVAPAQPAERKKFKYISCSYLSFPLIICHYHGVRFKYISCSYLSKKDRDANSKGTNLNTSHVLIYLCGRRWEEFVEFI